MKVLVLIDFEKEWIDESSDEYVGDISDVLNRVNKLIDFCRKANHKIIWTRHVEKDSRDAWAENSPGTQIIENLHKDGSDILITKNKISPFYKTDLEKHLSGAEEVVVCGILTNLCVRSFIQDAYDRDFNIKVITDCCVAFDEETQEFTFKDLKETREELKFLNSQEFLNNS